MIDLITSWPNDPKKVLLKKTIFVANQKKIGFYHNPSFANSLLKTIGKGKTKE